MLIRVFEPGDNGELIVEFDAPSVPLVGDVVSVSEGEELHVITPARWGVDDLGSGGKLIMVDVDAVRRAVDA